MKIKEKTKKVFVSGCFDLLHSGHISFLREASNYGDLYVSIGSDKTIAKLKGETVYTEKERLYIINELRCVKKVFIGSGSGFLDFEPELRKVKPDYLIVINDGGDKPEKRKLCSELGIKYIVLKGRKREKGLPKRSTTQLKDILKRKEQTQTLDSATGGEE